MSSSSLDLYASVFAFSAAFYFLFSGRSQQSNSLPLPPGPPKLPIIGNLLDLPKKLEWLTFAQWSKDYGSNIIHFTAAGTSVMVVNSFQIANELFDKRSSKYSSRSHMTMIDDLIGWDWLFAGMPYGEPWRERRKLFQRHFHPSKPEVHRPRTAEFVRQLLPQLLATPEKYMEHIRHMIGGTTLSLAYGIKILPADDPHIALAERAIGELSEAAFPGAFLVDTIPALKYVPEFFPGASFKRKAREWRKDAENFRTVPFSTYLESVANGSAQASFTSLAMNEVEGDAQKEIVKDAAGMFFAGGADTSVSAMTTFILAMLYYPEVQKKAQDEIDSVIGIYRRLPEFQDEQSLPYLSALVKEVLRWQPVAPLGIAHYLDDDDIYENFYLPGKSIVIGNQWAMLHNEQDYPDPSSFNPERYLKDGKLNPDVRDPATIAFGFGRRVCPGSHIATSILWLSAASILATFDISKAIDENGQPINPSLFYHSSVVSLPSPFKCTIKPRSTAAERLIQSAQNF